MFGSGSKLVTLAVLAVCDCFSEIMMVALGFIAVSSTSNAVFIFMARRSPLCEVSDISGNCFYNLVWGLRVCDLHYVKSSLPCFGSILCHQELSNESWTRIELPFPLLPGLHKLPKLSIYPEACRGTLKLEVHEQSNTFRTQKIKLNKKEAQPE